MGALDGSQLTEIYYENQDVISQPTGEWNFHVLYYPIVGLSD